MNNELMKITQISVIEENLKAVKAQVAERTEKALNVAITIDNLSDAKKLRAELNKEFREFEAERKKIKSACMEPYNKFEATYVDCISNAYKNADDQLKASIDEVTHTLMMERVQDLKNHFLEAKSEIEVNEQIDLRWVDFDKSNVSITLSKSLASIKKDISNWLESVAKDVKAITAGVHPEEVMVEYKNTYDYAAAMSTVLLRHKQLADLQKAEEEAKAKAEAEAKAKAQEPVEEPKAEAPKAEEPPVEAEKPNEDDTKIWGINFKVYGTKAKLRELKAFLDEGGYRYEQAR